MTSVAPPPFEKGLLPAGAAQAALDRLYPPKNPYIDDPVGWAEQKLGAYLWSKEREILEAVRDHRYVAVQACHGPGKSFTSSCAGSWWLDVHDLGSAFLVTTAPSWPQVEAILWREMRRRHREGQLPGRITLDCKWHGGLSGRAASPDEEIIGMGRKPADYDEHTFQGIHARYFMAILDEACGIDDWLWNAVLSLATNENTRVLAIGNPDDPNSRFAQICKPGSGWHVIRISVWDTPNFTGEYVPDLVAESLVSKLWVEDRRRDWGEGSPIWQAKVEGLFPDVSDEYLIGPALMRRMHETNLSGRERGRYGFDVARKGSARSVIYRNRGGQVRLEKWWGQKDTVESTEEAAAVLMRHGATPVPIMVDMVGLGAGVFDNLRHMRFEAGGFNGAERALNPKKFYNRRAETYWNFREMGDDGLIDLDPEDEKLTAELGSIKWYLNSRNQICIETKDEMEERGLPSPDHADAAVLSTVQVGSVKEDNLRGLITGDLLARSM